MRWLDVLVRNWPWKLLALVLSYAIWIAVTGESRIMQDVTVPLDLVLPDRLLPARPTPTAVVARLRGPENLLRRADLLRLSFPVDLGDAGPGPVSVQLDPAGLRGVPSGIEVVFVDPDRLSLRLDERARRTVPVVPAFQGKPAVGYTFYGASATPERKEVEGPSSDVSAVRSLRTDPIALDGRTEPFHVRVRAVPDNREVRLRDPEPVEVRVDVDALPTHKTVQVRVELRGSPPGASVEPRAVRAVVSGPPALLERLGPSDVVAVADLAGLAPTDAVRDLPLRIEFRGVPETDVGRLSATGLTPPSVSVRAPAGRSRG